MDYATIKAGIVAFSKALAKQAISKGIRVDAVAPGPFWTALQPSGGQPQEAVETFGSEVPLGRPGRPVELAPIYVFLASQEASFVTGEVYGATGGNGTACEGLLTVAPSSIRPATCTRKPSFRRRSPFADVQRAASALRFNPPVFHMLCDGLVVVLQVPEHALIAYDWVLLTQPTNIALPSRQTRCDPEKPGSAISVA